jgi:hypothetical protein
MGAPFAVEFRKSMLMDNGQTSWVCATTGRCGHVAHGASAMYAVCDGVLRLSVLLIVGTVPVMDRVSLDSEVVHMIRASAPTSLHSADLQAHRYSTEVDRLTGELASMREKVSHFRAGCGDWMPMRG